MRWVGHAGVEWVMQGLGGSYRSRVGWVMQHLKYDSPQNQYLTPQNHFWKGYKILILNIK